MCQVCGLCFDKDYVSDPKGHHDTAYRSHYFHDSFGKTYIGKVGSDNLNKKYRRLIRVNIAAQRKRYVTSIQNRWAIMDGILTQLQLPRNIRNIYKEAYKQIYMKTPKNTLLHFKRSIPYIIYLLRRQIGIDIDLDEMREIVKMPRKTIARYMVYFQQHNILELVKHIEKGS